MQTAPRTESLQLMLKRISAKKFNWLVIGGFFVVAIFYASGIFDRAELEVFNHSYADTLFLTPILIAIIQRLRNPESIVDPIYWLLLGSAFAIWFLLTLLRLMIWDDLSHTAAELLTNLAYFLYFLLTIAAIEVKSYQTAGQLLSQQSLLIWLSTLTFTLGAFILLALTPSKNFDHDSLTLHSAFLFYILMDLFLMFRWSYLAWSCRKNLWIGYGLFALSALFWAVSDSLEAFSLANQIKNSSGSWLDWIWYLPYLLVYLALQLNVTTSVEQTKSRYFTRSHFFNSPIFFAMIGFIILGLFSTQTQLLQPLNATQQFVINLWVILLLGLSAIQFTLLISKLRKRNHQLADVKASLEIQSQRMKQQAETLQNQSASNQAILETTHNAIFTLNPDGKILSVNPAACTLSGYSKQALQGANFCKILNPEGELARFFTYQSYRQRLMSSSGGIEIESSIQQQSGLRFPVHATLSQEKSNLQGLLVISLVNISEQKKVEQEAHKLKDQFTANISHEFRTPLTIINGVLDNLLNQTPSAKDREQLNTAKRNGLRMIRMVEQLLELSRVANDPIPISRFDAHSAAQFVCQSFEEIAKNTRITLQYQLQKPCWTHGNAQSYEKILFNLLSNAFKYTEKGSVEVDLSSLNDQIRLTVKDTGIGISPDQQLQVFERFHRVDNLTTQNVHGVGIGLALVKELCTAMNWTIQLDSALGQGTCFTLMMPIAEERTLERADPEPDLSPARSSESDPGAKAATTLSSIRQSLESEQFDAATRAPQLHAKKSKHSVLIVEDTPDMQAHIHSILSPHHQCLLASNGEEGVRLAIDFIPDIIVSDVMMPGISGFELLKTLKKTEITTHIPIILLTARSDSASKLRGLEAQADDYLSKPFDAKELLLRVNNQLLSREKLQHKLSLQFAQSSKTPAEARPELEDPFVKKLMKIFADNFADPDFTMLELTNKLAMSDRQAQRKIKAILGLGPTEALKQYRLNEARRLLEQGEQSGIVAQSCGFSSQSYFGRCFKEAYQLTPKAYQDSLRDKD